tara:strand:+ start:12298 stop:12777 length:480 start_codon:yes stop_codon:yes gene_type:complete
MAEDYKYASGVAYWASIVSPNTKFEADGVWECTLSQLDDTAKKVFQESGLEIKNVGDEKGDFVKLKRKVRRKDGSMNQRPTVVDSQNSPMDDTYIGNGSLVTVKFRPYDWSWGSRKGRGGDLCAIQVVDLVEYAPQAESFDPIKGGYVAPTSDDVPFPA